MTSSSEDGFGDNGDMGRRGSDGATGRALRRSTRGRGRALSLARRGLEEKDFGMGRERCSSRMGVSSDSNASRVRDVTDELVDEEEEEDVREQIEWEEEEDREVVELEYPECVDVGKIEKTEACLRALFVWYCDSGVSGR